MQNQMNTEQLEAYLSQLISKKLEVDPSEVSLDDSFFSLGIGSMDLEEIVAELSHMYPHLIPTVMFEYPDIASLAAYLATLNTSAAADETTETPSVEPSQSETPVSEPQTASIAEPPPPSQTSTSPSSNQMGQEQLETYLSQLVAKKLEVDPSDVSLDDSFFSLGIGSMDLEEIVADLSHMYPHLIPTVMFEYPDIASLATYLSTLESAAIEQASPVEPQPEPAPIAPAPATSEVSQVVETTNKMSKEQLETHLSQLVANKLEVDPSELSLDDSFFSLGIGSMDLEEIVADLSSMYPHLIPTVMFEYPDIASLAAYLSTLDSAQESTTTDIVPEPPPPAAPEVMPQAPVLQEPVVIPKPAQPVVESKKKSKIKIWEVEPAPSGEMTAPQSPQQAPKTISQPVPPPSIAPSPASLSQSQSLPPEGIAVIGMSGRFPQSPDLNTFWKNLVDGKECIEEIPKERWDYSPFFDEDQSKTNRAYGKWGGFLQDIDQFDPLFFKISPREAEHMDPQQRLVLESAWETMEDAGYGDLKAVKGKAVGVYIGVMWNEYTLYSNELGLRQDNYGGPGALYWLIPNRVSYFFDFSGPSLAIDAACASSLTAIHLGCQSILSGECEMALAGGVNLNIHPLKFLYLSQAKLLSSDGRCRSFAKDGTGYVPGEGVGSVLLKSLSQAVADGDQIYGVIKGTSINQGGKATGFMVPNPMAHTSLIKRTYEKANLNPQDLSYMEAFGMGTDLGDPIELAGLTNAFRSFTKETQYCPLGALKPNIGHLEAASGIASFIKVMLCFKHKMLPKSLHSDNPNPSLNFKGSPFFLVEETQEWKSNGKPRLAGLSSFGAGGSNAHAIVEEYIPPRTQAASKTIGPELILLSAQNEAKLQSLAQSLKAHLEKDGNPPSLKNIAYTLQVGRTEFDQRAAIITQSMDELKSQLNDFIAGKKNPNIHVGNVKQTKNGPDLLKAVLKDKEYLQLLVKKRNIKSLAQFWTGGAAIDWAQFNVGENRQRTSLPFYPFSKKRYWIEGEVQSAQPIVPTAKKDISQPLPAPIVTETSGQNLEDAIHQVIKQVLAKVLKMEPSQLDVDEEIVSYGIDSVMMLEAMRELQQIYSEEISPEASFEYPTIRDLAQYLIENQFVSASDLGAAVPSSPVPSQTSDSLQQEILSITAGILKMSESEIDVTEDLTEYGVDSITATEIMQQLQQKHGEGISPEIIFEHTTIHGLANYLSENILTDSSHLQTLSSAASDEETHVNVHHVDRDTFHPLSYAQEALAYLQTLDPDNTAYNVPLCVRIQSVLNVGALKGACQAVQDHQPALRTTYTTHEGKAVQQIHTNLAVDFSEQDYSGTPEELIPIMKEEGQKPIDLEQGPFFRIKLYKRSDTDYFLLLIFHHISIDGLSVILILKQLFEAYQAFHEKKALNFPPLKTDYIDFVQWQEKMVHSREGERMWNYWKEQLAGALPFLDLPTDFPRPPIQTYNGNTVPFEINEAHVEKLKALAKHEKVTLPSLMLSIYQVLLFRYTRQDDILVGIPILGRRLSGSDETVGYYVNMLAIRSFISGESSFQEFLKQTNKTFRGALAHQYFPFPYLVEKLQLPRDLSRTPVFQTKFVFQTFTSEEVFPFFPTVKKEHADNRTALNGLTIEPFPIGDQEGQDDLTVEMVETDGVFVTHLKYNTDLFKRETIDRMVGHYQTLIESVINSPEQAISALPILTPPEKQQLLVEWNKNFRLGDKAYPQDKCIHHFIEQQVERTPDADALVFESEVLTYRELNNRANQVAHYLVKLGVGPNKIVGIFTKRTVDIVVGILATLKAGGAYAPMDPNYPKERVEFMLEDAQAPVILTQNDLKDIVSKVESTVVCLDSDWEKIANEPAENLKDRSQYNDLAYVIYTSGSTGKPKGTAIEHHSTTTFMNWSAEVFTPEEIKGVLFSTSICFDLSVYEMFFTLGWGGTIILVENVLHILDLELPKPHEITLINTVPSAIASLVKVDGIPDSVKTINLAGEPLKNKLAQQVYQNSKVERIYDLYGPSEDTTYSTYSLVERDATTEPLIGKPVANTVAYIVDQHFNPVPIGIPGELYLGGDGLARCYLNRPELTSERFIENPFEPLIAEYFGSPYAKRIYQTGDLVRYLPDGNMEYLGRIDHQVKIRGFRIELGEIETRLEASPEIKNGVVMAVQDARGEYQLAAYFVTNTGKAIPEQELVSFLGEKLPEYMIPTHLIHLEELPLTPNGKINRKALPLPQDLNKDVQAETPIEPQPVAPPTEVVEEVKEPVQPTPAIAKPADGLLTREEAEDMIRSTWKDVLQNVDPKLNDNFFDIGGNSLRLAEVHGWLKQRLPYKLKIVDLLKNPTISMLLQLIENKFSFRTEIAPAQTTITPTVQEETVTDTQTQDIAIIGMACRFPKSPNYRVFWNNLKEGKECISFFSQEDLAAAGVPAEEYNDPNYVPAKGLLENLEYFDANFFGYSPREAQTTDPQHRIFLETAWEALEDAGYNIDNGPRLVGVFGGSGLNNYQIFNLAPNPKIMSSVGEYKVMVGNGSDFLCSRVSYKFNLEGPCVVVQTACSTSLTAIHLASQSLLKGECEMALAGGVSMLGGFDKTGYQFMEGMILSPDGHCRAFDAKAKGTIAGQGCGIVALKPLNKALEHGDSIHAVIKGTAVNNDGALKLGYTAPRPEGQAAVIRAAQEDAGIDPATISYIEAHGTGTNLGDPIEIDGLTQAFQIGGEKGQFCAIGSVKTNHGHLDAAAGVAGLMKTVLALKHKQIPPSLHFQEPNPEIEFEETPFYVNAELQDWKANGSPRRAGVSAFGIGGVNAHVVLEEAPIIETLDDSKTHYLLTFSARTESALDKATQHFVDFGKNHPEASLADSSYTLQTGRKVFDNRRFLVCEGWSDGLKTLEENKASKVASAYETPENPPVAFMFSGQGSQYINMGLGIYEQSEFFKEQIDTCFQILQDRVGLDLRPIVYPEAGKEAEATKKINQTQFTQPALFVMEYALARLLIAHGVTPKYMIGHSVGEYVAACLAGVFTLEEALELIVLRGKLIQGLPEGDMLSVALTEEECLPLLGDELSLAVLNVPDRTVISGPQEPITKLAKQLASKEVKSQMVITSHAFHSKMMEPILGEFVQRVAKFNPKTPNNPFISNVTGTWITPEQATNPKYWGQHLRQAVRFYQGIETICENPNVVFIESGPGTVLSTLTRLNPATTKGQTILSMSRHPKDKQSDYGLLLNTLGKLWLTGQNLDWGTLHQGDSRKRVALPTYPFESQRYWVDLIGPPTQSALPEEKREAKDWFYRPKWEETEKLSKPSDASGKKYLIFMDHGKDQSIGKELVGNLEAKGNTVYKVFYSQKPSKAESSTDTNKEVIKYGKAKISYFHESRNFFFDGKLETLSSDHYQGLVEKLKSENIIPDTIVHLWSLDIEHINDWAKGKGKAINSALQSEHFEYSRKLGFDSLIYLAKAIGQSNILSPLQIRQVSRNLHAVNENDNQDLLAVNATVIGPCKVISQEYSNIGCQNIDLPKSVSAEESDSLVQNLSNECSSEIMNGTVAYREDGKAAGFRRVVQTTEPLSIVDAKNSESFKNGAFIITGGVGGIGLSLGKFLAKQFNANLILTSRPKKPPFPLRDTWSSYDKTDVVAKRIRRIGEIEKVLQPDSGKTVKTVVVQKGGKVDVIAENQQVKILIVEADVANPKDMKEVVLRAQKEFGTIKGIIHAAGAVGQDFFKPIQDMDFGDNNSAKVHFSPKVEGTLALKEVLRTKEWEFCLFFSSISSLLGGMKYASYSGANAYLDQTAISKFENDEKFQSKKIVSIGLDAWRDESKFNSTVGMTEDEGISMFQYLFDNILSQDTPEPQLIISQSSLDQRVEQWERTLKIAKESGKKGSALIAIEQAINAGNVPDKVVLEALVKDIWEEHLGVSDISPDDDYFALGGDSLLAVHVVADLKAALNINLPNSLLIQESTADKLSTYLSGELSQNDTELQSSEKFNYLVEIQKGDEKTLPLFLPPPVGGNVYFYRELAVALGKHQPVYAFQASDLTGESSEGTSFKSIEDMAKEYLTEMQRKQPHGPYLLGGASLGGIIALEMIHQLEMQGEKAPLLTVIDSPGPDHMPEHLTETWQILLYLLNDEVPLSEEHLKQLEGDQAQIDYVLEQAKQVNKEKLLPPYLGTPYLDAFKAHEDAMFKHVMKPYTGQIVYFRPTDPMKGQATDMHTSWVSKLAKGKIDVFQVPGNHITMNESPNVEKIVSKLKPFLEAFSEEDMGSLKN